MTTTAEKAALLATIHGIQDEFNTEIRPRMLTWGPQWQAAPTLWSVIAFQNSLVGPINALTAALNDKEAEVQAIVPSDPPPPPPPPGPVFTSQPNPVTFTVGAPATKVVNYAVTNATSMEFIGTLPPGVTKGAVTLTQMTLHYDGNQAGGTSSGVMRAL